VVKQPAKRYIKIFNKRPVIHSVVTGNVEYPKAGDELVVGPNKSLWIEAKADDKGTLNHEYLKNGWAYATVNAKQRSRAILRAKGYTLVYVNGVPRVSNI